MFIEHQIIILEWFLKDHVTMKTGVMMKIELCHHWKIYILKYVNSNRKQVFYIAKILHSITIFTIFFNQINAHVERFLRDFIQKHLKILQTASIWMVVLFCLFVLISYHWSLSLACRSLWFLQFTVLQSSCWSVRGKLFTQDGFFYFYYCHILKIYTSRQDPSKG